MKYNLSKQEKKICICKHYIEVAAQKKKSINSITLEKEAFPYYACFRDLMVKNRFADGIIMVLGWKSQISRKQKSSYGKY